MAFSSEQLQLIEREVGALCERRFPADLRDQIYLRYDIKNHQVLIREVRRDWRDPSKWVESDVAKLRYLGPSNEWRLYWKRASGKWWLYEPHSRARSLSAMLAEIDLDSDGCFFG
jgi:hypothetical protein